VAASTSGVHAGDDLGDRATPLSGTQLRAACATGRTPARQSDVVSLGTRRSGTDPVAAFAHAGWIAENEGRLINHIERPLNHSLTSPAYLAVPACCFYAVFHYVATPAVLNRSWRRGGPTDHRRYWTPGAHLSERPCCLLQLPGSPASPPSPTRHGRHGESLCRLRAPPSKRWLSSPRPTSPFSRRRRRCRVRDHHCVRSRGVATCTLARSGEGERQTAPQVRTRSATSRRAPPSTDTPTVFR
jgi:hypothetical protein